MRMGAWCRRFGPPLKDLVRALRQIGPSCKAPQLPPDRRERSHASQPLSETESDVAGLEERLQKLVDEYGLSAVYETLIDFPGFCENCGCPIENDVHTPINLGTCNITPKHEGDADMAKRTTFLARIEIESPNMDAPKLERCIVEKLASNDSYDGRVKIIKVDATEESD